MASRAPPLPATAALAAAALAMAWVRARHAQRGVPAERKLLVGMDVGATAVKLGVFRIAGAGLLFLAAHVVDPCLPGSLSPEQLVERARELTGDLVSTLPEACWSDIVGFGAAIPGRVEDGWVLNPANFPLFGDRCNLAELLSVQLGIPNVRMCNDANAALLGELHHLPLTRDCVFITLGSGVGAAVISEGRLLTGSTGMFGEIGHTIIHAEPGARRSKATDVCGIVEEYASARAVQTTWVSMYPNVPFPGLAAVFARLSPECQAVADYTVDQIAVLVINAARAYDPSLIILGGGLPDACPQDFLSTVRMAVAKLQWSIAPPTFEIKLARLGNSAGMYGAASLLL